MSPVSPAVQLRLLLAEARSSELEFEHAWGQALRCVKWPHDTSHRIEWKQILGDGKDYTTPAKTFEAWRGAYYREVPTRNQTTLSLIAA